VLVVVAGAAQKLRQISVTVNVTFFHIGEPRSRYLVGSLCPQSAQLIRYDNHLMKEKDLGTSKHGSASGEGLPE